MLQRIQHIVKHNFFGIEEPNNVDDNCADEQEIVVSPDVAEHLITPETTPTDEQVDIIFVVKEDGEIPSELCTAGDFLLINFNWISVLYLYMYM